MYNIERHRVESLKNYTPALNKALELSADKKIFKACQDQYGDMMDKIVGGVSKFFGLED